jgi:uncharacterized membrane protein YGL010W
MSIQVWFDKYAEHHQNPVNKLIHWFCVPAIFFSLIGLLSGLSFSLGSDILPLSVEEQMHAGTLLIFFGVVFLSRLSMPIAIGMALFSFLILKGITFMYGLELDVFSICLGIFAVAWIGQFIGHRIEGEKPSFYEDLKFLLIGPAWLLSFIYKKLGITY